MDLQPPPNSKHIRIVMEGKDVLRIELGPGRVAKAIRLAFIGGLACFLIIMTWPEFLIWLRSFTVAGLFGLLVLLTVMGPVLYITGPWLWFGKEILLIRGRRFRVYQGLEKVPEFSDELDLGGIQRLRYEPFRSQYYRATIQFHHGYLDYSFGKDLTESEARWIVGLIQFRIDAVK